MAKWASSSSRGHAMKTPPLIAAIAAASWLDLAWCGRCSEGPHNQTQTQEGRDRRADEEREQQEARLYTHHIAEKRARYQRRLRGRTDVDRRRPYEQAQHQRGITGNGRGK